jgi:hypothetical protein
MPRMSQSTVGVALLLLAAGCSDQHLVGLSDGERGEVDEAPLDEPDPEPIDAVDPDPDPEPTESCDTWLAPEWSWTGSQPFFDMADLADSAGIPFWDPAYASVDWSDVLLPDVGPIPQGADRAYRAVVTFDELPPGELNLSLSSDDGLWLWVNGTFVGHWGGGWQQEGCVNENAGCLESVDVADQDVTDLLVGGENVIAARVSNPVMDAWFEVEAHCVDW